MYVFKEKISRLLNSPGSQAFFKNTLSTGDIRVTIALIIIWTGYLSQLPGDGVLGGLAGTMMLPGIGTIIGTVIYAILSGGASFLTALPAALWWWGKIEALQNLPII